MGKEEGLHCHGGVDGAVGSSSIKVCATIPDHKNGDGTKEFHVFLLLLGKVVMFENIEGGVGKQTSQELIPEHVPVVVLLKTAKRIVGHDWTQQWRLWKNQLSVSVKKRVDRVLVNIIVSSYNHS